MSHPEVWDGSWIEINCNGQKVTATSLEQVEVPASHTV